MTVPAKQSEALPSWLEHLRQNPDDDLDAVMQLRLPMSVQMQIMAKAKELGVSSQDVVVFALIDYGVAPETLA
jgi:hypothetical protein